MRNLFTISLLLLSVGCASAADVVRVAEGPFVSAGAFFIARDKGYFKKLGIEIETTRFEDGAMAIPSIVAGEIDISNMPASASLFNSVAKGAPLIIILDRGNDSPERAYTSISVTKDIAESGVRTPADFGKLKGKRIGVAVIGSINQYSMARALEKAGLDPTKDVEWISNVSQPDLMKMLGQKQIDAAAISYQFSMFAQNNGVGPMVATGGDIEPNAQIATFSVRKDFLAKKRDVVVRWAMAYLQGVKDFNAAAADPKGHAAEIDILAKNTVLNKPELLAAIAPHWSAVNSDGVPNVDSIMAMQDFWSARFNLVQRKVSREQLFDLTVASEALTRLKAEHPFD
ncbi:ABC transporter substrate-binding protein [Tardiphaga sp.]|uniref:ABC transporter substrate-binding protein n=1 Tax=Tardiphaga sp. TaxID=1926292 RepID=UPI0025ECD099|nr:ABC transporter substrate-binding protein [Tardiphaga sp.]